MVHFLYSLKESRRSSFKLYRYSQLSYLLKNTILGKSHLCIIGTISPMQWNADKTIYTVRFLKNASRAMISVEANQIPVNQYYLAKKSLQQEIRKLKDSFDLCEKIYKTIKFSDQLNSIHEENKKIKLEIIENLKKSQKPLRKSKIQKVLNRSRFRATMYRKRALHLN